MSNIAPRLAEPNKKIFLMVSLVSGTIGLVVAAIIILLIRRDKLHVNHGVGWMIVAFSFAFLGLYPGIIDRLAVLLGISYPPVLALTLCIAVLVIKILLMDIERSRIEMRNQRLVQRIGMLETDIKKLRDTMQNSIRE